MKIGTYFEISNESRPHFESSQSKLDWYEVMGRFGVGENELRKYDIEESVGTFAEGLSQLPSPLSDLFMGEFQTETDSPDPNVSFLSRALVMGISEALNGVEDTFLDNLVINDLPPNGYVWLTIGLREFFHEVADSKNAIVCLWE